MRPPSQSDVQAERLAVPAGEAARLLSISRSKVYALMDDGELPYVKLGKSRRILLADLVGLMRRHMRGTDHSWPVETACGRTAVG